MHTTWSPRVMGKRSKRFEIEKAVRAAERIRQLRTEEGWSVADLSRRSGVPVDSIRKYEDVKKIRAMDAQALGAIAEAFGRAPDHFTDYPDGLPRIPIKPWTVVDFAVWSPPGMAADHWDALYARACDEIADRHAAEAAREIAKLDLTVRVLHSGPAAAAPPTHAAAHAHGSQSVAIHMHSQKSKPGKRPEREAETKARAKRVADETKGGK